MQDVEIVIVRLGQEKTCTIVYAYPSLSSGQLFNPFAIVSLCNPARTIRAASNTLDLNAQRNLGVVTGKPLRFTMPELGA